MRKRLFSGIALAFCVTSVWGQDLSLRLAKVATSKEWEQPAIFSYVRNDGGDSSYNTRGTLAYGYQPKPGTAGSDWGIAARLTWNRNTLVGSEANSRSVGAQMNFVTLLGDATNAQNQVQLSLDIGASRNDVKESNAVSGGLTASAMLDPLISAKNASLAYEVLPSVGVFQMNVRRAPFDIERSITPIGNVRGNFAKLDITLIPNFLSNDQRWIAQFSVQELRKSSDVTGGSPGNFRLSTAALSYRFNPTAKKGQVDSALTLSRQVGEDPWNEVERGGFTQLAFTVKY